MPPIDPEALPPALERAIASALRRMKADCYSPNGIVGKIIAPGLVVYPGEALGLPFDVHAAPGQEVYGPKAPPPEVEYCYGGDFEALIIPDHERRLYEQLEKIARPDHHRD